MTQEKIIADIIYDSEFKPGKNYSGEGNYLLVLRGNNECIGNHYCSTRGFAEHDLLAFKNHREEIEKHQVVEIYSLGKLVWCKNEKI